MSKPKKNPSYLSIDNISTRTKKRFLHITSVLQQIDESKKTKRLSSSDQLRHTTKIGTLSFVNGKIMGI